MHKKRVLIIGANKDCCFTIRSFLESQGIKDVSVLGYAEGMDRLFYEKPDITVLEAAYTHQNRLVHSIVRRLESSGEFKLFEVKGDGVSIGDKKRVVFFIKDPSQVGELLELLKGFMINGEDIGGKEEDGFEETGTLNKISYPYLILHIYHNRKTGILRIDSSSQLTIYFVEGIPIFAEGGEIETALGKLLLESGRISELDYERLTDVLARGGKKAGEILLELGLVSPHELSMFLELQVKEKLIRGFKYTYGKYSFKPQDAFGDSVVRYEINPFYIVYEGINRFLNVTYLKKLFFDSYPSSRIRLNTGLKEDIELLAIGTKKRRFLEGLKDEMTVEDVVNASKLREDEALKILYFLFMLGFVEIEGPSPDRIREALYRQKEGSERDLSRLDHEVTEEQKRASRVETPESSLQTDGKGGGPLGQKKEDVAKIILDFYSSMEGKNYYEILGVPKEAGKEEIKDAYFRLARRFHPDANPGLKGELKDKCEEVFARITLAYQTLSNDKERELYDSQGELFKLKEQSVYICEAEFAYKEAEVFLKQRRYREAEEKLKQAVNLNPEEPVYVATLAWVNFVMASDKNSIVGRVRQELERAVERNPKSANIHYYLGHVYKHLNDIKKAEKSFAEAVKCNPDFIEAKRELRLIERRRAEELLSKKTGKRFWSIFFRK
jgi:curved DNA-binding protein CbpA